MSIEGKFLWIWELDRYNDANINTIIQKANEIGIDGFILKTHDGSSFWYQSHAIPEIKNAGLKCGAWGYCYGKNVAGEIDAIKKTASFKPDFYVLDIETEFEAQNMGAVAEQLLLGINNTGIPIGYTSFAIPSYHTVPYNILSKYCSFTMPQIYWVEMNRQLKSVFDTSISEYKAFNLPVYPVGQITKDVPAEEIVEFSNLCRSIKTPAISYWDLQEAGDAQLKAIKESNDIEFNDAVKTLQNNGIVKSPDYWIQNSKQGKTVNGQYVRTLILRMAQKLK
ncbi:MAG TPA: hypothetical protein VF941_14655 [Clostridia bacterium]